MNHDLLVQIQSRVKFITIAQTSASRHSLTPNLFKVMDGETGVCKQVELPVHIFEAKREVMKKRSNDIMWKTKLKIGWWRRGRVELPVQKRPLRVYYKLSRLFVSPVRPLPTEFRQVSRVLLVPPIPASGQWHPDFSSPTPIPSGRGWGGRVA